MKWPSLNVVFQVDGTTHAHVHHLSKVKTIENKPKIKQKIGKNDNMILFFSVLPLGYKMSNIIRM
jgi:hypothetical protein